jgi:uncharacterized protein YbjT (DUF2867 family)
MTNGKKILISGATGLIGRTLTLLLAQRQAQDPGLQVVALVRRKVPDFPPSVSQVIVDYAAGADGLTAALTAAGCTGGWDAVACCIGSTMRAAGSEAAFLKIERDIPLTLVQFALAQTKRPLFLFVSSLGAGKPMGFYLQTKASVEKAIRDSGLPHAIVRPSLLMGDRTEHRPGERFAQLTMPALFNILALTPVRCTEWFRRYRPIHADVVARAMAAAIFADVASPGVLEGSQLIAPP